MAHITDGREPGGRTIDLERLEAHARDLYLTKFVEAVKRARVAHGKYLVLRAGDELAIRAAGDGSAEVLDDILVKETTPPSA